MSNRAFLTLVASIIVVLVGALAISKFQACMELGGKACPRPRFSVPNN
ncbi:MAG TPA: hypothetical protein VKX28_23665 [Xanthobacteraceae bacterium]|nr:hypothetical protein [Xanthobacteraceae bacterium]